MRPCIFYREPQLEIFNLKMDKFFSSKKGKKTHLGIGHSTLLNRGLLETTSTRIWYNNDAKYT